MTQEERKMEKQIDLYEETHLKVKSLLRVLKHAVAEIEIEVDDSGWDSKLVYEMLDHLSGKVEKIEREIGGARIAMKNIR